MKTAKFTYDTKFKQNSNIIVSYIDNEVILMNLENGFFFGLNATASEIWKLLDKAASINELYSNLKKKFHIERCIYESDMEEVFKCMIDNDIIRYV